MRPTDHLKSLCQDDWTAATTHAFTDALADGKLDLDKMRGYLQQDYLFVEEFVRLLAAAISNAPTLPDAVPGAQFLAVVTGPENTYFQRSLAALDVPEAANEAPRNPSISVPYAHCTPVWAISADAGRTGGGRMGLSDMGHADGKPRTGSAVLVWRMDHLARGRWFRRRPCPICGPSWTMHGPH